MGRKRKRIVRTKPIPSLPIIFDCPLCGTTKAVQIDIKRNLKIAIIKCGKCGFESSPRNLKTLDERVDVYGDWLDELSSENDPVTPISENEENN